MKHEFLYPHQKKAVEKMQNGCILNGGVGSGKSRTALYYYFIKNGGVIDSENYEPMKKPKDLYIITTAMKRDNKEWIGELSAFLLSPNPKNNMLNGNKIVIDSWQNIKKYVDTTNSFFIFDEDFVTGYGAWVKSFLKITKNNEWIILSATPGDKWEHYIPVFIANGFYRNKSEFIYEHVNYDPRCRNYPKVIGYRNTGRLIRLRNKILVDMDFSRKTIPHHETIWCDYDKIKYKEALKTRWDPYKNEPMQGASSLCIVLRHICNEDISRQTELLKIFQVRKRIIVFYNFDYELNILLNLNYGKDITVAQWNGHAHEEIPRCEKWVYLVNYNAGAEGWNCITTDTVIFYSQNYSYKTLEQARGRIDRLNTPFKDLYYYYFKSRSSIDLAINKALSEKRDFNEGRFKG